MEEVFVTCGTYQEVATAIRDMIVRGAPAIGVAAAMGIALGVKHSAAPDIATLRTEFGQICRTMGETRPTAVNLFWAIRRMQQKFEAAAPQGVHQVKINLVEEAQKMLVEDIAANEAMGRHGATLMPSFRRDPHTLQCRRFGNVRLRHGAWRHQGRHRFRQKAACFRR